MGLLLCVGVVTWLMGQLPAQQNVLAPVIFRIAYATYLGGRGAEQAREVIPHEDGSALVGGQTDSTDFPTTEGVVQPRYAGDDPALGHPGIYGGDCFLAHLSPDGRQLIAATYFGGSRQERNVYGMELDREGNVVLTSATRSPDLPTTDGCFQPQYGGGPADWGVAKLSPDLRRLLWCTYVGGSGDDFPRGGLALDERGYVYVVGTTASPDFPTTPGALQRSRKGPRDSAIVKLKPDGSGLVYGTLLGGTGEDDAIMGVRLDQAGNAYVAGHTQSADFPVTPGAAQPRFGGQSDCYLAKLSADAGRLLYATYLGGGQNEFAEHRPALTAEGSFLLTGVTASPDFPTTANAFQWNLKGQNDGFLTQLSPDGTRFLLSTFLGGSGGEFFLMPTLDGNGNIYLVGQTSSRDFPVTPQALQSTYGGGPSDGVLAVFSPEGATLRYATYLGGSGEDLIRSLALGPNGEVYLVGSTSSLDFPVTPNALQSRLAGNGDAFVVKLVIE